MQWERNILVIIPDKHVATRGIIESMAAYLDLDDAMSLLGPQADNDGTILETMKLVLVATHDFDDECALIDVLAVSGFLEDSEQLVVCEHEMARDERLLSAVKEVVNGKCVD